VNHVLDRLTFGSFSFGATTEAVNLSTGAGANTFNVQELNSLTTLTVNAGGANDTLNLTATGQNLNAILGNIIFNGEAGTADAISANDQTNAVSNLYVITPDTVDRPTFGLLTFQTTETLTLNGGSEANPYDIDPVSVGLSTDVIINAGSADDLLSICPTSQNMQFVVNADLTFNGGSGSDQMYLFDGNSSVSFPYSLSSSSVTRGASPISYSSLEVINIDGAAGANDFGVSSLVASTQVTLAGNGGNDRLIVGGSAQILDNVDGTIDFTGGVGTDSIELRDTGTTGNTTYTVTNTTIMRSGAGNTTYGTVESLVLNGGSGGNTINIQATQASMALTLNCGNGDDFVEISPADQVLHQVAGNVAVKGNAGADTLTFYDRFNLATASYTLTSTKLTTAGMGTVSYETVENWTLLAGNAGSTIDLTSTAAGIIYDLTGNDGNDTITVGVPGSPQDIEGYVIVRGGNHNDLINVEAASASSTVNVEGGANDDEVRIAPTNRILGAVAGDMTVDGSAGTDSLTLFDSSNAGPTTYGITSTAVTRAGVGAINYGQLESLIFNAGVDKDTLNVESTASSTPLELNCGGGSDTVRLAPTNQNLSNVAGAVFADGQAGSDVLVLFDIAGNAATTYSITSSVISRAGMGTVVYGAQESLTLEGSNFADTFNVIASAANTPVTVKGNNGDDTFHVGSGNLTTDLPGNVTVLGGFGFDTDALIINDSSNPTSNTIYTISSAQTSVNPGAVISYADLKTYRLNCSARGSTFNVNSALLAPFEIFAAGGTDNINVLASAAGSFVTVDAGAGLDNLTVNGDGAGTARVMLPSAQDFASLSLPNGSTLELATGGDKLLKATSLSMSGNGKLDLNDNDFILDYSGASQVGAIRALINSARNFGDWLGSGITSSIARTNPAQNTTLGAMEATDYDSVYGAGALFNGVDPDATAVLVKYTYYGDTDFNGLVDGDDYARTDSGFNLGFGGWLNGDADGNGFVDGDDYALIDNAYSTQSDVL
jgi:hypothetical protein